MGKMLNLTKDTSKISDCNSEEDSNLESFYHRMFERDIYIHISEISVAMVGVCLTGVSIMQVDDDVQKAGTYIDDILAIDSFIFLTAAIIAYWAIRVTTNSNRSVRRAGNIANVTFLIGMILMVVVCASMVLKSDFASVTGK